MKDRFGLMQRIERRGDAWAVVFGGAALGCVMDWVYFLLRLIVGANFSAKFIPTLFI